MALSPSLSVPDLIDAPPFSWFVGLWSVSHIFGCDFTDEMSDGEAG